MYVSLGIATALPAKTDLNSVTELYQLSCHNSVTELPAELSKLLSLNYQLSCRNSVTELSQLSCISELLRDVQDQDPGCRSQPGQSIFFVLARSVKMFVFLYSTLSHLLYCTVHTVLNYVNILYNAQPYVHFIMNNRKLI